MDCPVCKIPLENIQYQDQSVDICKRCGGIWFDKSELYEVITSLLSENKVDFQDIKEAYMRKPLTYKRETQPVRKCPRCGKDMLIFNYSYDSNVILDRCLSCEGIWTDRGEIEQAARYAKGNATLNRLSIALAEIFPGKKSRRKTIIFALGVSCVYLISAFIIGGLGYFLQMSLFLIWPLAFIFFGEQLSSRKFLFRIPPVTKPTPVSFLVFGGWVLFLFPLLIGVWFMLFGSR
ncbi:MAG: zf-TFIIB domain-containing protein [Candidatus Omnitrophica bacterium]|nr:zf-TFIIB domain-containing protein [Candidatus Omnitrophota bacterium]